MSPVIMKWGAILAISYTVLLAYCMWLAGLTEAPGSYVITPLVKPPLDGCICMERVRKGITLLGRWLQLWWVEKVKEDELAPETRRRTFPQCYRLPASYCTFHFSLTRAEIIHLCPLILCVRFTQFPREWGGQTLSGNSLHHTWGERGEGQ